MIKLILEEQINEYASDIPVIILKIKAKHQNVVNIRPLQELNDYLIELNNKIPDFDLPYMDPELIFLLGKDLAVVIKSNINSQQVKISCDNITEYIWTVGSIIFFPGCTLIYNKSAITPTKEVNIKLNITNNENNTEDLHPVNIEVEKQITDPRLQELRDELSDP